MLRGSRVFFGLTARGLHTSRCLNKAEFFRMPAMSPTMDKGGVADWKFNEGQAFNAGDVLLEVETDKSQIDVEAQDDGVLAKILVQNGASDIAVGTPIAVIADPADDLTTLELPKDESDVNEAKPTPASSSTPAPAPAPEKTSKQTQSSSTPSASDKSVAHDANPNQVFFPSVAGLLSENNISREEAIKNIRATGNQGRLLKGDVLAYLGKISKESVINIASFVNKHSHLDLSSIERLKITPKETKESKGTKVEATKPKPAKPEVKKIIRSFHLESVLSSQEANGHKFTLQEYIERASGEAERYAYQSHPKQSDYYDPVFEEIIAPPTNIERFSVKLNIPKPTSKHSSALDDIFNDVIAPSTSPELTVEVTLNSKLADSEEKANLYLEKLQKYL